MRLTSLRDEMNRDEEMVRKRVSSSCVVSLELSFWKSRARRRKLMLSSEGRSRKERRTRLTNGDGNDLGSLVRVTKDLICDERRLVQHGPSERNDEKSVREG